MAFTAEQTKELRSHIVCPLLLKIAIDSGGKCGAISSYRCQPRANGKAWETRPAKPSASQKGDKWREDFFKVLNAKTDETVTLSDGETQMNGIDRPSDTRFEFTDEDGRRAWNAAMRFVVEGDLVAPRNWDEVFAGTAGITKDDLAKKYPELYATKPRTGRAATATEKPVEDIPSANFFGESIPTPDIPKDLRELAQKEQREAVAASAMSEDDEDPEEEYDDEPDDVVSYSIEALEELSAVDAREPMDIDIKATNYPPPAQLNKGVKSFTIDLAPDDSDRVEAVKFYKVKHPVTGRYILLHEGENPDFSNIYLSVQE